jgi:hypothetical protein
MLLLAFSPALADPPRITIWHGKTQRVGHLGVAQNDFNVLGRVSDPDAIVRLTYEINDHFETPLSFRSYRRLLVDGDFNADVPLGRLTPGPNKIVIRATNRHGETAQETVTVVQKEGRSPLPFRIRWSSVKNAQDVGQFVDGRWAVEKDGLRTKQTGYDRVFPITLKTCYAICFVCKTLPDTPDGAGVTQYSFKVWPTEDKEPEKWDWQHVQTSQTALRTGGVVLLAHHVDVTFGSTTITAVEKFGGRSFRHRGRSRGQPNWPCQAE